MDKEKQRLKQYSQYNISVCSAKMERRTWMKKTKKKKSNKIGKKRKYKWNENTLN